MPWIPTHALYGELGPRIGLIRNIYMFGIYLGFCWLWQIVLGAIALRRVQQIPVWAAALTMVGIFGASMFLWSAFIR